MNNSKAAFVAGLIANCWLDKNIQNALVADPKRILREHNIEVPIDADIQILVDEPGLIHIVLANEPLESHLRIDDLPKEPTFLAVYAYIYEKARTDETFCHRFLTKPTKIVRELGFHLPETIEIIAYKCTTRIRYLVIPFAPKVTSSLAIKNEIAMLAMSDVDSNWPAVPF